MMKKGPNIFSYFFVIVFLTGCWDHVSIEERGFVVGSAIDMEDEKIDGNYQLTLTNQFVVPPGVSTNVAGASDENAFVNLVGSGDSIRKLY